MSPAESEELPTLRCDFCDDVRVVVPLDFCFAYRPTTVAPAPVVRMCSACAQFVLASVRMDERRKGRVTP